ncbi:hypothetical protein MHU86_19487 [Fragilaria crotonensis]|nr:hypothetical protein MHU86_19487 [Fragilaria crotonensis]
MHGLIIFRNSRLRESKNSLHHKLHHRHLVIRGGAAATTTNATTSATVEGLKSSLASALAAGCSKTLLAPFDTLKTIQQNYRSSGTSLSFWQAVKLVTSRPNGIRELYAGLGVAVVGSMPSVGLYFGVYSYCKRILVPHLDTHFGPNSKHQLSSRLLFSISVTTSAAIGNTVASFSRVPYEVVKQNLQTAMYTSTWQALSEMTKQGGLRAFFPLGGVAIQMLRDIPYAMVTLLSYEILKQVMLPLKDKETHNYPEGLVDAVTGALAGGLGSYVTNPLDVIKTRIQTNPDLYAGSIAHCTRCVARGWGHGILAWICPKIVAQDTSQWILLLFYEFFQTVLKVHVLRS